MPSSSAEASITDAGSIPSTSEASISVAECDVEKLLQLGRDLHGLEREDKY